MVSETFRVEILEPRRPLAKFECASMVLPGFDGELTVLARHAAMLSELKAGLVKIYDAEKKPLAVYFVSGGFFRYEGDLAQVSAEVVQTADQIDGQKTQEAKKRAQARLEKQDDSVDVSRALAALARARAREALLALQKKSP